MRLAWTKLNTQEGRETRGLGGRQESKNEVACLLQRLGTTRVVREGGGLLSRGETERGRDGEMEKSLAQLQGLQALCGQHLWLRESICTAPFLVMEESGRTDSAESSAQAAPGEETEIAQGLMASPGQGAGRAGFGTASHSSLSLLSATFPFLGHSHPESSMDPAALQLPASAPSSVCRMSFLRIPSD